MYVDSIGYRKTEKNEEKKIFFTFGVIQGDPKGQIQAKLESYFNLFQIITVKPDEVQTSPNFQDSSGLVY